jgi:hypothetical protein
LTLYPPTDAPSWTPLDQLWDILSVVLTPNLHSPFSQRLSTYRDLSKLHEILLDLDHNYHQLFANQTLPVKTEGCMSLSAILIREGVIHEELDEVLSKMDNTLNSMLSN